ISPRSFRGQYCHRASRARSCEKLLRLPVAPRYGVAMSPRLFARLLLVALLASTLSAEVTPPPFPSFSPASPSTTITAAFWNIQWFPGRRPNASRYEENRQIRAVHRDLGQFNTDIIGLEEVRDSEHASIAV